MHRLGKSNLTGVGCVVARSDLSGSSESSRSCSPPAAEACSRVKVAILL